MLRQTFGGKALEVLQSFKCLNSDALHRYMGLFCKPMQYDKLVGTKEKVYFELCEALTYGGFQMIEIMGLLLAENKVILNTDGSYQRVT